MSMRFGVRRVAIVGLVLFLSLTGRAQHTGTDSQIRVLTRDNSNEPIASVIVQLISQDEVISTKLSDIEGKAEFSGLTAGSYEVFVSQVAPDFPATKEVALPARSTVEVAFIVARLEDRQQITVRADEDDPIVQGASPGTELQRSEVKSLPSRPATVTQALPFVPGVVRSPDGRIQILGSPEEHSAVLINSVDVKEPGTEEFGITAPIDSVEKINVFTVPYLAQYGGFTAGVVSVETRRGGEKWNFDLNDPMPDFRIRSWRVSGLRDASPHLALNGALIPKRLYFAEGFQYELRKRPVVTLPYPFNETRLQLFNSFTQLDYLFSPRHTMTATLHFAPEQVWFANLDFFNPQPVTPNFDAKSHSASLLDRLSVGGGVLQSTLALGHFGTRVLPQGPADMILTPTGNRGNYFSQQDRRASRIQWLEAYSLKPLSYFGHHNVQLGMSVMRSESRSIVIDHPVDILDNTGLLLKRIEFAGGSPVRRSDLELASYAQDHWVMGSKLALDFGVRAEKQGITDTARIAPRVGFVFSPFANRKTALRGGYGIFYDRVPLNVYFFDGLPRQLITTFEPGSQSFSPARQVLYLTQPTQRKFILIDHGNIPGNFAPYSAAWNIEVEHRISRSLLIRANYLQRHAYDLLVISPTNGPDALVLGSNGNAHYQQIGVDAQVSWKQGDKMFVSYVRSHAQGNFNDFNNYLGNFPFPVVPQDHVTDLPGDVPNRWLARWLITLPAKIHIEATLEYRTGFPYQIRDAVQNVVWGPLQPRFPDYFSLDGRLTRDFQVTARYALRVAFGGFNLTNHFNPVAVHSNMADPQFGTFFGSSKRRPALDLDVLF